LIDNNVDDAAVQFAVAVAIVAAAIVAAAAAAAVVVVVVAVQVAAAAATVVDTVDTTAVVAGGGGGFVVRVAVVGFPTLRGWIRNSCYWAPARLMEEVVEPRGDRIQSGEYRLEHDLVHLL
jgi:hypothetical protein